MTKKAKIYIAGHRGMVSSAVKRKLKKEGLENLIFRTSSELDLRNQQMVQSFLMNAPITLWGADAGIPARG